MHHRYNGVWAVMRQRGRDSSAHLVRHLCVVRPLPKLLHTASNRTPSSALESRKHKQQVHESHSALRLSAYAVSAKQPQPPSTFNLLSSCPFLSPLFHQRHRLPTTPSPAHTLSCHRPLPSLSRECFFKFRRVHAIWARQVNQRLLLATDPLSPSSSPNKSASAEETLLTLCPCCGQTTSSASPAPLSSGQQELFCSPSRESEPATSDSVIYLPPSWHDPSDGRSAVTSAQRSVLSPQDTSALLNASPLSASCSILSPSETPSGNKSALECSSLPFFWTPSALRFGDCAYDYSLHPSPLHEEYYSVAACTSQSASDSVCKEAASHRPELGQSWEERFSTSPPNPVVSPTAPQRDRGPSPTPCREELLSVNARLIRDLAQTEAELSDLNVLCCELRQQIKYLDAQHVEFKRSSPSPSSCRSRKPLAAAGRLQVPVLNYGMSFPSSSQTSTVVMATQRSRRPRLSRHCRNPSPPSHSRFLHRRVPSGCHPLLLRVRSDATRPTVFSSRVSLQSSRIASSHSPPAPPIVSPSAAATASSSSGAPDKPTHCVDGRRIIAATPSHLRQTLFSTASSAAKREELLQNSWTGHVTRPAKRSAWHCVCLSFVYGGFFFACVLLCVPDVFDVLDKYDDCAQYIERVLAQMG